MEKYKQLQLALRIAEIGIDDEVCRLITELMKLIDEKGDQSDLKSIVEVIVRNRDFFARRVESKKSNE